MAGQWVWLCLLVLVSFNHFPLTEGTEEDDKARLDKLEELLETTQNEQRRNTEELRRTKEEMRQIKANVQRYHDDNNSNQPTCKQVQKCEYDDYRPIPYLVDGKAVEVHGGCQQAYKKGWNSSGVFSIMPDADKTFTVYCKFEDGLKDFRPNATMNVSRIFRNCPDAYGHGWRQSGLYTISFNGTTTEDVHCEQGAQERDNIMIRTKVFTSCLDALQRGYNESVMYNIRINDRQTQHIYCDQGLDEGGWEVIQQRRDGSVDFFRLYAEYVRGFGDRRPGGSYWLGLEAMYQLTRGQTKEVKIEGTATDGSVDYKDYSNFWLEGPAESYKLHVGGYTGSGVDVFAHNNLHGFSTTDHDVDTRDGVSCADLCHAGWWYANCSNININGHYRDSNTNKQFNWYHSGTRIRLSGSRMLIRGK